MIYFTTILLCLALALLLIPVLVLLVQAVMAFAALPAAPALQGRRPRVAVLIPAHNEENGIAPTIASVLAQLVPGDRVVTIADNCSDGTAAAAATAGAEVRERFDDACRGKGYALDHGVRFLAADPPEVLLIVDADCLLSPGSVERLARTALHSGRPVQALDLMHAGPDSGPMKKIAEFAWAVKNFVRPLGFHRLGLPCQLMGTGMAFPWPMISAASLANGNVVEDMKLGMDLAKAGTPALFCPHAKVSSLFPVSAAGADAQRARWEHGHISMIVAEAPGLFAAALRQRSAVMLALALDLCVPPVALLTLLVLALSGCALLFFILAGALAPLVLAGAALAALGTAILLSWWRYGRDIVTARHLLMALFYMLLKLPLYLRFFVRRQVEWVRAQRDSER